MTTQPTNDNESNAKHPILLVGNFLSGHTGNHCVCEELATRLEATGLVVLRTSNQKARLRRLFDMVTTILRRRSNYKAANVDVYSGLAFGLAEASCLALRAAKRPYVLSLHGGNLPNFSKRWPRRVSRLLERAYAVTTPSTYLLDGMKAYRNDIRLIPNSLDVERYPFRLRDHAEPRIVWVRSFHEIYNPSLAIDVIAELAERFPGVHLTMVGHDKGDGSLSKAKEMAKELKVADRIDFVGGVPKHEIPKYLDTADVFINTTNVDNTPVSVLEAMACGLCVVSTNVGGIPHLITHNDNGMMVEPRSSVAMSDAINRILTDNSLVMKLSQNAHRYARQFDWQSILPQWTALFEEVTHHG